WSSGGNAEMVGLKGAFLVAGLGDVHIHPEYPVPPGTTPAQETANFGRALSLALTEAGVTGVRCGGAAHFMDVAWRRVFDAGDVPGPRVFACGHFLTTTGGHFLTSGQARECDGPYGFVQAIREQIKNGVDHIKLNLTGGIMGPDWDRHWHSFLLKEELSAAFAICRQREFPVMAHAANPDAVKSALKLGAHTVEHGYIMDEECIATLSESPTWYVPTLAISHLTEGQAQNEYERQWLAQRNIAAELQCRADAAADEHAHWFKRALDSGAKMALGSDIRPLKDAALLEMGLWVRDGATTWQTLQAATRNAAELCGVGNQLGTVEVGKLADLIVVGANPLDDINNLRQLQLVIKGGRIVSDKRG
ncbi:MAG: amidohydrolase family protein, partial [Chloroflexi bacterium]|nr:amidohydrolase family protein [Chloroflexota bacterium]